jgi:hypothetical protein
MSQCGTVEEAAFEAMGWPIFFDEAVGLVQSRLWCRFLQYMQGNVEKESVPVPICERAIQIQIEAT